MSPHSTTHQFILYGLALTLAFATTFAQSSPGELDEVQIEGRRVREFRAGALKDDIVKTEVFDATAIENAHAFNVNQVIEKNPGIAVQTECSICNVRNINLNNLPGRFTTLLIDGIPLYSALSMAYGLDSVNVRGVESIDVARGAGASLIAPEALAGTVNIVTKRPTHRELEFSGDYGHFGAGNFDGYAGMPLSSGALSFDVTHSSHETVDAVGAGISQYTGYERTLAGVGFFLDHAGPFRIKGRLDYVDEKRGGGAVGSDYAAIKTDTSGNPFDWSRGPHASSNPDGWFAPDGSGFIPYEDGRGGFSEIIFTKRYQALASGEAPIGTGTLRLAGGYARHEQDSYYEMSTYDAKGDQYYLEISGKYPFGATQLTAGLSYRHEDLASRGTTADGAQNNGIDDYRYEVPGVFLQTYRTLLEKTLEINASLRADNHNVFGMIYSPRVNLLYHHAPSLSSRLSLGRGYRAPTSFFEQDHGILDTTRIVREIDKPERSSNLSYALNYSNPRVSATLSYNYNRVKNFALLDPSATDDLTGDPITLFTSSDQPVTVQGIDVAASFVVTQRLDVSMGAEKFNYSFEPGTLAFSRPDAAIYLSAEWHAGRFELFGRTTWTGSQDLARFYDYANNPRFNLDGSPKQNRSPSFATIDLRGSFAITDTVSLYAGADNLFNYRQAKRESFLWLDAEGGIDVTHFWGPSRGRYAYAGVQLSY